MAKKKAAAASFPTRRRVAARQGGSTFIQRSRGESSEQKAIFHNVSGAGRSHVKRPFFGVSDEDAAAAVGKLNTQIEARLRALST
jgi:hypothetical protein